MFQIFIEKLEYNFNLFFNFLASLNDSQGRYVKQSSQVNRDMPSVSRKIILQLTMKNECVDKLRMKKCGLLVRSSANTRRIFDEDFIGAW